MQIQRWPLNLGDSCGVRSTTRARRCAAGALADSDDRPETEARTQYLSIHSQRRWCSVLPIPPRFLCWPVRLPLLSGSCHCVSCFLSGRASTASRTTGYSIQSRPACRSRFTYVYHCTLVWVLTVICWSPARRKRPERRTTTNKSDGNGGVSWLD